jgi:hypothetical protein
MSALVNANLGLRFLLELAALAAVGYWGWQAGSGGARPVLSIAAVSTIVVIWALFISPQPTIELPDALRLGLELAVWTAAGAALYASTGASLGITFLGVAVLSGALNYGWS